jgi:hypothetical protein
MIGISLVVFAACFVLERVTLDGASPACDPGSASARC